MIHNCLLLKPLRITRIRRKELHNKFNSPVCSQNMNESGQNYLGSQNTQVLNAVFGRPLKGVFTEFNAISDSFCIARKKRCQPSESFISFEKVEDRT